MNRICGLILPRTPHPWRVVISWRRPGRQGAPRLPALSSPGCSSHPAQQCSSVLRIYSSPRIGGLHQAVRQQAASWENRQQHDALFLLPLGLLSQPQPRRLQHPRSGRAPSQNPAHPPVLLSLSRPQPWFQNRGNHVGTLNNGPDRACAAVSRRCGNFCV